MLVDSCVTYASVTFYGTYLGSFPREVTLPVIPVYIRKPVFYLVRCPDSLVHTGQSSEDPLCLLADTSCLRNLTKSSRPLRRKHQSGRTNGQWQWFEVIFWKKIFSSFHIYSKHLLLEPDRNILQGRYLSSTVRIQNNPATGGKIVEQKE